MKHERTILPELPAASAELGGPGIVLDLLTEGRFWRTSKITGLFLIHEDSGNVLEESFTPEKESDEYDLLVEAAKRLEGPGALVTYNGDSFDLPHLRKKYAAYGLPVPFDRRTSLDLYRTLKPLSDICALPSRRLAAYTSLWTGTRAFPEESSAAPARDRGIPADSESKISGVSVSAGPAQLPSQYLANDARQTFAALAFLPILRFWGGAFSVFSVERAGENALCLTLHPRDALPIPLSLSAEGISLTARGDLPRLTLSLRNGFVRRYFPDYKNYDYLPAEGYAIHKSVSAYVAAGRKEPAAPETCFALVPAEKLFKDPEAAKAVAKSVLERLCPSR